MDNTENSVAVIRAFIALPVPADICRTLLVTGRAASDEKPQAKVRWLPVENIHLTMAFLGDRSKSWLDELNKHLQQGIVGTSSFDLTVDRIQPFPRRRPRIISAMIEPNDTLQDLYVSVIKILTGMGFEPEQRPFLPHLTLARSRTRGKSKSGLREFEIIDTDLQFRAEELQLIESVLDKRGAQYKTLGVYKFK